MRLRVPKFIPREIILMAFDSVRAHKFRSFLTVLGIVIGVMTAITIASILTGLRANIVRMIEEYGTNNIYAFHLSTGPQINSNDEEERTRKPFKPEDGEAIREQASAVEDVSSVLFVSWWDSTISYNGKDYHRANMQGVTANYGRTANVLVQEGRFLNSTDDEYRRDVMVIGVNVAQALFPYENQIVGTKVKLGGKPFEIVGVLEKRKNTFFGENDEDNAVYIPFRTAHKISPGSEWIMFIMRAREGQMAAAMDQIEDVLRRRRAVKFNEPNNFDVNSSQRLITQFDSITGMVGIIAIAISSLGLLVGGIGVMNIMLVSVTERTQEIGVRKAIGATRRDIVRQFLYEAMTLTFLGGVLGVVLAIGVSKIVMLLVPSLPASIPGWAVISGLTVSIAVGLVFGVWPARKASRLDPIECLRYE
jgi:putative ABC transport system permease protein